MAPANSSPQQWFIESAARRLGPYTLDQLKAALNAGKVTPQTPLITAETSPGGIEKRLTLAEAIQEAQSTEHATPRDATMTLFDALQATKNIQRERQAIQHAPQMSVAGAPARTFSLSPRLAIALGVTVIASLMIWAGARQWSQNVPLASTTGAPKATTPSAVAMPPRTLSPQPTPALPLSVSKPLTPPTKVTSPLQQTFPRSFGSNPALSGNSGVSSAADEKEKERERERDREYEREREREKRRQMEAWSEKRAEPQTATPDDAAALEATRGYKDPNARPAPSPDGR